MIAPRADSLPCIVWFWSRVRGMSPSGRLRAPLGLVGRVALAVTVTVAGAGGVCACGARTGLEGEGAEAPPRDAAPAADVYRSDCPDPSATLVFVVTVQSEIWSFDPSTRAFKRLGALSCDAPGATPFSMAVDRHQNAYVVFDDGQLFKVDVAHGQCSATDYVPGQSGFSLFGMGFATNAGGPSETLFVAAADPMDPGSPHALATIDTTSFALRVVAPFDPSVELPELTGTGDGRLFAFDRDPSGNGSFVDQIDTRTASVLLHDPVSINQGDGWAFAFWGGDFWTFTAAPGSPLTSIVTRFRPSDGSVEEVASLPSLVVGAGVSTCAPE